LVSGSAALEPDDRFKRSVQVLATEVDGETVMLAMETGVYHSLGGVGARIWALLEDAATVDQIAEKIAAEYAVPTAACREDTIAFFEQLRSAGLIEPV
jgi:hypothetical protein